MEPLLVQHLEQHIGKILHGWSTDARGNHVAFQVVQLENVLGVNAYSTLGLSKYSLQSRVTRKSIRSELIMLCRDGGDSIPGVLQQVGQELVNQEKALLRGDVIGPKNALIPGSQLRALYASIPVYLPDSFGRCEAEQGPVVFIWLIPISLPEVEYVRNRGWDAFEKVLQKQDPDLTDFFRQSVVF